MLSLRLLCGGCSALLMYIGLLVYQDEQQRFKSRVETLLGDLWVRLSDLQAFAYRNETLALKAFRQTILALFDFIMGKRIVSVRAFAVSVLISSITGVQMLVVAASFSGIVTTHNAATRATDVRILFFSLLASAIWLCVVYLCRFRWLAFCICVAGPLFISFGISFLTAYDQKLKTFSYHVTSHLTQVVFVGALIGTWLSIVSDLSATAFVRILADTQAPRSHRLRDLAISFGSPFLITCLPYLVFGTQFYTHHKGLLASFSAATAATLTYLNADIVAFVIFVLGIASLLTAHHVIWPTILRLLYFSKDIDLLPSRKALLLLGVTLAVGAIYSPSILLPLVKRQLGIPETQATTVDQEKSKQASPAEHPLVSLTEAEKEQRAIEDNTHEMKPWLTLYVDSAQRQFSDLKGTPQGPEGQQTWTVPRHPMLASCQIDEVPSVIVCTLLRYTTCEKAAAGYKLYSQSLAELLPAPWKKDSHDPFPAENASSRFLAPNGVAVVAWLYRDATADTCHLYGAIYAPPKPSTNPKKGRSNSSR